MPIEQNIKTEDNRVLKTYPLAQNESDHKIFARKLSSYYNISTSTYNEFDDMLLPLFNAIQQEASKGDEAGRAFDDETILGEIFNVAQTRKSYQALCRQLKELKKQPEEKDRGSHSLDMSDWCDSCLLFHCLLHKPPIKFQRRQQLVSSEVEQPNKPCSNHCFLMRSNKENVLEESMELEAVWSSADKSYFELLHSMFSKNYCQIAKFLETKTCKEVQEFAFVNTSESVSRRTRTDSESSKSSRQSSSRKASIVPKWERRKNEKLHTYVPCNHDGNCSDGCPCFDKKNFCEVFCGCADDCSNRHRGLLMIGKKVFD